ncbi:MAG: selenocysteine-specific translation elongation factor [Chloroflexi bacterium]|nr:selenocysteine-specific translation elongation factor [Chloroflexota bacterium]
MACFQCQNNWPNCYCAGRSTHHTNRIVNARTRLLYVIGTAGHVDHGKSTLVKALTGIDPDRLKEEKEREMTIDLGFAWLKLPNGEEVGVVDVPGHERLVRNMLAGVGGIDLALLIVAADEGVMPQTREHLAILDLLGLKQAIVVLTKKDLVDSDWLELVTGDVKAAIGPTSIAGAPIAAVSSATGEGIEALKRLIGETLAKTEPRKDLGRPRLNIDRSFVMTGFGTVVTGTLIDGSLAVGQEIEIVPTGLRGRIRGLQSHRKKVESTGPGRRLAVNISGVDHGQIERGDILTNPGWLGTTIAVDVQVQLVRDLPGAMRHNAAVTFHTGTFESPARLRLLDADELAAGASGWAQLRLDRPTALVKGDLFILRSSWGTIGGGHVLEPRAQRHRRFDEATLGRLEVIEAGTPEEVVLEALMAHEPCAAGVLAKATNRPWSEVRPALETLEREDRVIRLSAGALNEQALMFSKAGWQKMGGQLRGVLTEFHQRSPLRRGMAKEEVRAKLGLTPAIFALALQQWVGEGIAKEEGPVVGLPAHETKLAPGQRTQVDAYLKALRASPYSPPPELHLDQELLNYLIDEGQVVRTSPDVVFAAAAYREMSERIVARLKESGKITLAEVRDMFGTSRKYVQSLLENMDQQRVTRRVGDERVLR